MATDPALQDPLLSLRRAIASDSLPTPTTTSDVTDQNATTDLAQATHLYFAHPIPQSVPLTTPTRFVSSATDTAVDLRSIFFAWQKKDVAIPEYIASAQELNEALKQHATESRPEEKVLNLVFVERLDLITWLEGASDESEYIKPLDGAAAAAQADVDAAAARAASAAAAAAATGPAAEAGPQAGVPAGRGAKVVDPRLQEIYNGERKLGDRNSVLRGIKPTVRAAITILSDVFFFFFFFFYL
jgi:parafibromin